MKIKYLDYLHSSKEGQAYRLEDLLKEHPEIVMTEEAKSDFRYNLYEVEFQMVLDTETGKSKIFAVKDI